MYSASTLIDGTASEDDMYTIKYIEQAQLSADVPEIWMLMAAGVHNGKKIGRTIYHLGLLVIIIEISWKKYTTEKRHVSKYR